MLINGLSSVIKAIFNNVSGSKGIGKTLLLSILFFSTLITIVLSSVQLYIDYKLELDTMNTRLNEIDNSYKKSIEASLWNVDYDQLRIQLEGIKQLPDIQMVRVSESQNVETPIFIQKGESVGSNVEREYSLNHFDGKEKFVIGTLYVEASLSAIYQRLIKKALTILLVQGIKTFLVSFFILFVFYRLVTRHIVDMEAFLKNVNLRNSFAPLSLSRKPKAVSDELDHLVNAYNSMVKDLRVAYDDVKVVNKQLKKDIAARKKAEAEVKLLNEELEDRVQSRTAELEAANKELNAFCYSVSHDLRAPLRRVDGFRRNLTVECSDKLDQRGVHYLLRMEACTREMNAMIDSFLILAKSTNTELLMEKINLTEVVTRVFDRLQEKDPEREVSFYAQRNIKANGDGRLIELLISNLIDNAWKYTAKTESASIRFYQEKRDGEQVFIIEDNGVGFNMEFAQHLFAPFTRLHKVSDFQGIGIGLATVKRVTARHGGRVWVESSVDNGAKFFFTLKAKGAR